MIIIIVMEKKRKKNTLKIEMKKLPFYIDWPYLLKFLCAWKAETVKQGALINVPLKKPLVFGGIHVFLTLGIFFCFWYFLFSNTLKNFLASEWRSI